jgi:large subunit ribosomal protein L5
MPFFEVYNYKVIRYDLINTFVYQNLTQVPRLQKIILNFGYPKSKLKNLISGLLALEFLSSQKGKITKSRHLNVFLKIKKGNPVGCKLVLKKSIMNLFYLKLMTSIFPRIKRPQISQIRDNFKGVKSISFQLKNPLLFIELENQFQFFKDTPKLDITLTTNTKSRKELLFLFKSIKFFS